jgi:hypothetical protein
LRLEAGPLERRNKTQAALKRKKTCIIVQEKNLDNAEAYL